MKALLWDHPRVCGEKGIARDVVTQREGSPPRVRGKENGFGQATGYNRITPACAGKSVRGIRAEAPRGDHPRVCGEKSASIIPIYSGRGSPPRVRGKD